MAAGERDIVAHESQLARRVGRLFRAERGGRFARRRELAQRLGRRRGELIEALISSDMMRRTLGIPISAELRRAVEALWRETGNARRDIDVRLDELRADLLMARGDGIPSGIRGATNGRIVGRG